MKIFFNKLFSRFGELLLKIVGSRKSFYQLLQKVLALYLILSLKNELYIVITFAISSIADFVYFGFIEFEKVKTEVKVGN